MSRASSPNLTTVPIGLATGSADHEGRLVLIDGRLLTVLVRLADDAHGADRGTWFMEAGFGALAGQERLFPTLEDAVTWISQRIKTDRSSQPSRNKR